MKKPIIILLLLIIAALVWKFAPLGEGKSGEGTGKIYGTVEVRDASLAFNEQERLVELLVEEGDRVEQGQVLARLNTQRLEAAIAEVQAKIQAQRELVQKLKNGNRPQEIDQARAEVEAAQVRVANFQRVAERLQKTAGSGASSRQAVDDALAQLQVEKSLLKVKEKRLNLVMEGPRKEDIAVAESGLKGLEASLSQLEIRLLEMTLVAPSAGVIQSRILEKGEIAGPKTPVYILALTGTKWVRAYVSEPDLGKIKNGMQVEVANDSYPGEMMQGQIGYISPTAEFTPRAIQTEDLRTRLVYQVKIVVRDEKDHLRLGMPVTVMLESSVQDERQ